MVSGKSIRMVAFGDLDSSNQKVEINREKIMGKF